MKKIILFFIFSSCFLSNQAFTLEDNKDSHPKKAEAHFKLCAGYNMQTITNNRKLHKGSGNRCAMFDAGLGTDIRFLQRAKGLSLQLQASYVMHSKFCYTNDEFPTRNHYNYASNGILFSAGPQYEFGHWLVRPLVRAGISYSLSTGLDSENFLHLYTGAGCAIDVGRHTLLVHADYWTNTKCKFFLTTDFVF